MLSGSIFDHAHAPALVYVPPPHDNDDCGEVEAHDVLAEVIFYRDPGKK
jgi:hypothetical protein